MTLSLSGLSDTGGSEKVQAAQPLVNPYTLHPKTARGLETEAAWMVVFRV